MGQLLQYCQKKRKKKERKETNPKPSQDNIHSKQDSCEDQVKYYTGSEKLRWTFV